MTLHYMSIPISYGWLDLHSSGRTLPDLQRPFLEGKYRFWGQLSDLDWTPGWELTIIPRGIYSYGRPLDGRGSHAKNFEAICRGYDLNLPKRTISASDIGKKIDRELAARTE